MPRGDPRSAPLPVRLTKEEKGQLTALADSHGMTLSEAARHAIQATHGLNSKDFQRKSRGKDLTALSEVLGELRRVGGLYALQAKGNRQVSEASQGTLNAAITAAEAAIRKFVP